MGKDALVSITVRLVSNRYKSVLIEGRQDVTFVLSFFKCALVSKNAYLLLKNVHHTHIQFPKMKIDRQALCEVKWVLFKWVPFLYICKYCQTLTYQIFCNHKWVLSNEVPHEVLSQGASELQQVKVKIWKKYLFY